MSYPDGHAAGTRAGGAYSAPVTGPGAATGSVAGAAAPPAAPPWQQSGSHAPGYPASGGYPRPGEGYGVVPLGQPVAAPQAARRPPQRADPARLLGLAVAALGGLNFCIGFLPEVTAPRLGETLSVYAVGPAYVPILLLIAGLLALAAFLPGSERSRLAVAAVSVGGAVGAIVSLGTPGSFELFANPNQVTAGLGAILLVVFGIVQAVIAIAAYVVGADTPWSAARSSGGHSSPGVPGGAPAPAVGGQVAPVGYSAEPYGYRAGDSNAPMGYPAANPPASGGQSSTNPPAPGWIPLSAPPREWPRPDERATGPQVVVGTESDHPEQSPRDTLSTSDTGPIAVVDEPAPTDDGAVSLARRDSGG